MNRPTSQLPLLRWWSMLLACLPLCLCFVQCLPVLERACQSPDDCIKADGRPHCFKGVCSKQACDPGVQETCFDGPKGRETNGICRPGKRFCDSEGQWSTCTGQVLPQREICDRLDNDCDGTVDTFEGLNCSCQPGAKQTCYSGLQNLAGKGSCKEGVQVCEADYLWGRCLGQVLPSPERCNKLDDDCDGEVDEGISCSCKPGVTQSCYDGTANTQGVGPCKGGIQTCDQNGRWGDCVGQVRPQIETCNNIDDDCDGQIDSPKPSCLDGKVCEQGTCSCPSNHVVCGALCVETMTSFAHCGACNNACKLGQYCNKGTCSCPPGQTLCGDSCVQLDQDAKHCGRCGKVCEVGEFCTKGVCSACPNNQTLCGEQCCPAPNKCCNNTCVNASSSPLHCGACGKVCTKDLVCCDGGCVDLLEDNNNCGACGVACSNGQTCCRGICVDTQSDRRCCGVDKRACTNGQDCCNGLCRLLSSDDNHCGGCGNVCGSKTCCEGICVDLNSTSNHCGTCGNACSGVEGFCCDAACFDTNTSTKHCGACGNSCSTGQSCCNGQCADLSSDVKNCGTCGVACASGEVCCEGGCLKGKACPTLHIYKGSSETEVVSVVETPTKTVVVGIEFEGSLQLSCGNPAKKVSFITATPTDRDILIAEYSSSGQCIWVTHIGGGDIDSLRALAIDSKGIITLAGSFGPSSFKVGSTSVTSFSGTFTIGQLYPGVIQLTSNGSFRGFTAFKATHVKFTSLAVVSDEVFVAGETEGVFQPGTLKLVLSTIVGLKKPAAFVMSFDTSIVGTLKPLWVVPVGQKLFYRTPTALKYGAKTGNLFVVGKIGNTVSGWPNKYNSFVEVLTSGGKSLHRANLTPGVKSYERYGINDIYVDEKSVSAATLRMLGHSQNTVNTFFVSDSILASLDWNSSTGFGGSLSFSCGVPDSDLSHIRVGPQKAIWFMGHALARGTASRMELNSTVVVRCAGSFPSIELRMDGSAPSGFTKTPRVHGMGWLIASDRAIWVGGEFFGTSFNPLLRTSKNIAGNFLPNGFLLRYAPP